ncbi:uncharacterized protein LOC123531006 [Mercenaria mercenaria]|uniref:uncharacterized protein LOC123531006 n=1 Tax=Mercenaria mercenaria TaxID=6596 RepID=UPI00234F9398|nr:uncharacterized protein LOC123531006 [Mercenaria mercenaria]
MINSRKIIPTAKGLADLLKEKINYLGGEHHLKRILKELGFSWRRVGSIRKQLMERSDIVFLRAQYLRKMKASRDLGRPIIYTDDTFVHAEHTASKCWQSEDVLAVPFNKGDRLIIVHAGSEAKGAGLVFKSKSRSGDYHDEMNSENIQKLLTKQLIPNLLANSVVVIDNAPYHNVQENRCPSQSTLKAEVKNWLRRNNIRFDDNMLKPELLESCKRNKPAHKFVVDNILKNHGHDCIRLPPYHADLNAIELIWDNLKRQIAVHNFKFNLKEVSSLVEEAFGQITTNDCGHVKRVEAEFLATGCCQRY